MRAKTTLRDWTHLSRSFSMHLTHMFGHIAAPRAFIGAAWESALVRLGSWKSIAVISRYRTSSDKLWYATIASYKAKHGDLRDDPHITDTPLPFVPLLSPFLKRNMWMVIYCDFVPSATKPVRTIYAGNPRLKNAVNSYHSYRGFFSLIQPVLK